MREALLVIDMQSALVPGLWQGEALAERIAVLASRARARGVPVIMVQQTGPAGTAFDPADPGWQLSPLVRPSNEDVQVSKSATDSFFQTELANLLTERGVDTVVLTGAATDYCVDATARSALSHGLNVVLVGDGHAPTTDQARLSPEQVIAHHNQILASAIHPGGTLRVAAAETLFGDPDAACSR